jgi:aspartate aminotransferase
VIIPAPYWVSYSELVKLTGATPVILQTDEAAGFKLTPTQLRRAITPASRLLMLNSPCNPTGSVYRRAELQGLADVVLESELMVLSDEIYEQLIYGDSEFVAFASLDPELFHRTVTVSGVSKSYAMTGWRIGWAAGPIEVSAAMDSLQSQETSNPCSISQFAALAALQGDQGCVATMRAEFARRREYVVARIRRIPGLSLSEPDGAFYAFFSIRALFGSQLGGRTVQDSTSFCAAALETAHVALVPGSAFGAEGYVRMSFAAELADIQAGLDRLARMIEAGVQAETVG